MPAWAAVDKPDDWPGSVDGWLVVDCPGGPVSVEARVPVPLDCVEALGADVVCSEAWLVVLALVALEVVEEVKEVEDEAAVEIGVLTTYFVFASSQRAHVKGSAGRISSRPSPELQQLAAPAQQ